MRRLITAVAMLAGMVFGGAAHSGAIISFQETGGNVVGTLSGSLNLGGLTTNVNFSLVNAPVLPNGGVVVFSGDGDAYQGVFPTGLPGFGSGGLIYASSSSGDSFILDAFYDHNLGVPTGYAGGPLSATMTFSAQSFSTLGMTPGEYVYPYYDRQGVRLDDVTVRVGRGTVPEPASLALLGLGLAGIGYQRRKRSA